MLEALNFVIGVAQEGDPFFFFEKLKFPPSI